MSRYGEYLCKVDIYLWVLCCIYPPQQFRYMLDNSGHAQSFSRFGIVAGKQVYCFTN